MYIPRRQFFRFLTNPPALLGRFPFDHGILEGLKDKIQLQVVREIDNVTHIKTQNFGELDHVVAPYAMTSREAAIQLRNVFVTDEDSNRMGQTTTTTTASSSSSASLSSILKIAIVNRSGPRHLLNEEDILRVCRQAFPQHMVELYHLDEYNFTQLID